MAKIVPLTGCQKELWLSAKAALSDYAETSIRGCYRIDALLDPDLLRRTFPFNGRQQEAQNHSKRQMDRPLLQGCQYTEKSSI